jgi:hypothetical protein
MYRQDATELAIVNNTLRIGDKRVEALVLANENSGSPSPACYAAFERDKFRSVCGCRSHRLLHQNADACLEEFRSQADMRVGRGGNNRTVYLCRALKKVAYIFVQRYAMLFGEGFSKSRRLNNRRKFSRGFVNNLC